MERRRHTPSPDFRLPQPFNSVKNDYAPLSPSAPLCRFLLTETMTTAMDRADAEITHQYGPGARHNYSDTIVVFNLETGEDGVYKWAGSVGDSGLAYWDQGQKWIILTMDETSGWFVGKVKTSAIASGACGLVELYGYDWVATGLEYDVYNPHDVELPVDLKVRWTRYPGWSNMGTCETNWVVEPWHFTEC